MYSNFSLNVVIFIYCFITATECSKGDHLPYFTNCSSNCVHDQCLNETQLAQFYINQPKYFIILGWNCSEECKYNCMWNTVDYLMNTLQLSRLETPQFYGKVNH